MWNLALVFDPSRFRSAVVSTRINMSESKPPREVTMIGPPFDPVTSLIPPPSFTGSQKVRHLSKFGLGGYLVPKRSRVNPTHIWDDGSVSHFPKFGVVRTPSLINWSFFFTRVFLKNNSASDSRNLLKFGRWVRDGTRMLKSTCARRSPWWETAANCQSLYHNDSAADWLISQNLVQFDHVTADTILVFKVKWSKVNVTCQTATSRQHIRIWEEIGESKRGCESVEFVGDCRGIETSGVKNRSHILDFCPTL